MSVRLSYLAALRSSRYVSAGAIGSRRAFSRSCARERGTLPVFLESSKPELSSLLSILNSKILAPAHFTKEQKELVYKMENKAKLEAEPVEITFGDVTIPLEHIDVRMLPNHQKTFTEIVYNSETREDCENVVRMLEGMKNAGIRNKGGRQTIAIRHLNSKGMQHLVLKALQRGEATGLSLKNIFVVSCSLHGVRNKASLADWDKEETTKALKMATQIVELMEQPEHYSTAKTAHGDEQDHRGNPFVIAVPTGLAAVLAEKHNGDVERVKTLASRLVAALKQSPFDAHLEAIATQAAQTEADFNITRFQVSAIAVLARHLADLVAIWHALKTSRNVLGADMPSAAEAGEYEAKVKKAIEDSLVPGERLMVRNGKQLVDKAEGRFRTLWERERGS